MAKELEIRLGNIADLPAIAAIQKASPEASAWAPLDYTCHVVVLRDAVAGFIVTREIVPGECEILNLAVHPVHRRRGVAKILAGHVIRSAPGRWFLEVRESNAPAIALYETLGFRAAGHRENYYNDPPESAIVMSFFS